MGETFAERIDEDERQHTYRNEACVRRQEEQKQSRQCEFNGQENKGRQRGNLSACQGPKAGPLDMSLSLVSIGNYLTIG